MRRSLDRAACHAASGHRLLLLAAGGGMRRGGQGTRLRSAAAAQPPLPPSRPPSACAGCRARIGRERKRVYIGVSCGRVFARLLCCGGKKRRRPVRNASRLPKQRFLLLFCTCTIAHSDARKANLRAAAGQVCGLGYYQSPVLPFSPQPSPFSAAGSDSPFSAFSVSFLA